MRFQNVV